MYDGYDIVIGGDFNVDFDRPSRNLSLLIEFVSQENLARVSTLASTVSYTFESSTGSRSFIDHFIVSESINISCSDLKVLNDAINL